MGAGPELLRLPKPLECRFVERLNRFVALVECGGKPVRAYLTNTGRLKDLLKPGAKAYCVSRLSRRTEAWLIAVDEVMGPALIDTRVQERCFEEAVKRSLLPWLRGFDRVFRAPRVGDSVLDFMLEGGGARAFVEVKSAVLRTGPSGEFASYPDCRSLRGERHLRLLRRLAEEGLTAVAVFVAGLAGVKAFTPYDEGDPAVRPLLRGLASAGGLVKAVELTYDPTSSTVTLANPDLPVLL